MLQVHPQFGGQNKGTAADHAVGVAMALDTFKGVDFAVAAALKASVMLLTVVG